MRQLSVIQQALCVCQSYLVLSVHYHSLFNLIRVKTNIGKGGQHLRLCVLLCPRYITGGDTHSLCVVCLRVAAESLCERLSLRMLYSWRALFEEGGFTSIPRGAGPAFAEVERLLCSWESQMDQVGGIETGEPLSSSFPTRSSAHQIGSPPRGFFPLERGLDALPVFLRGGGHGGRR